MWVHKSAPGHQDFIPITRAQIPMSPVGDTAALVGTQTELVEYSGNQGARSTIARRQEPRLI